MDSLSIILEIIFGFFLLYKTFKFFNEPFEENEEEPECALRRIKSKFQDGKKNRK